MTEKTYFELFKIEVNESLIFNPTREFEAKINKAFQDSENNWKQLKLKNLGKVSDGAAENLKKLKAHEFDILKDPEERKNYYLEIKKDKIIELKTELIESNEAEIDFGHLQRKYKQYLSDSEMLDESNLFTAFGFDENASYGTTEKTMKKKMERLQKQYDSHPIDSKYQKYINLKSILKKFQKEVYKTDEFKNHYEDYKTILRYSNFIQLLIKVRGKDITAIYFNDILLKKAEEAGIEKQEFTLFLMKYHMYFGIKGISPVTDYYIKNFEKIKHEKNDKQQEILKGTSVKEFEYSLGRSALKAENLDEAYYHFKEANNIDPGFALYELAELYYSGTEKLPKDLNKSYKLHQEAIKEKNRNTCNNRYSLYRLSQMTFKGEGCKKDEKLGFSYLKSFISSNNSPTSDYYEQARLDLAECYYKGRGTAKDYKLALNTYHHLYSAAAKKQIKKIERELSYKPSLMICLYIVSYIILCLVSMHYIEKVFSSSFNRINVLTYFSILFAWMIYSGLFLSIKHSWLNQLKGIKGTTAIVKIVRFFDSHKKAIISTAVLLFGGVCFYWLYTKGIIKPWLTEEDYGEIPELVCLLLDYGVNWVTAGIMLIVLLPLINIINTNMCKLTIFGSINVNFKSVLQGVVCACIFVFGIYYAVQWSATNVLTEFSVLKYIGITIFISVIAYLFNLPKIIKEIFNGKTAMYTLAALLLYGALTCATVAENYGDIPIATTIVQVMIAYYFVLSGRISDIY
ncbi:sel1 repeat family protein [Bacillus sp. AGMB 02131]|uniref:Sel1 repeat family protein n=1 Tax=Peribacillus faecalis TaxID=2772559 RepID=A0A927D2N8_9BACI|nr:tetratricopeptide repeat protein [Peribacillus faecalis]MBD3110460.1 sel1 repeat family protein [Peribacillus faecalis]